MKRRDFMKIPAFGMTLALTGYSCAEELNEDVQETDIQWKGRTQIFNMHDFQAPPCLPLRVGYIGLGNRGYASLRRLAQMEGVEIRAIADCYEYPVRRAQDYLKGLGLPPAAEYFASKETWKDLCARDDLDLIYVTTPPFCHAEMAVHAMLAGKHTAVEVPAAQTLADCLRLVDTSEKTRKHCLILENCIYDFFESMTIQMAQKGFFGEIIHGEGAYCHCGGTGNVARSKPMPPLSPEASPYYQHRLKLIKGNAYPTHGFGPVAKAMRILAGDRIDYLSSVETNDFVMGKTFGEMAEKTGDPYFRQFAGKTYGGGNSSIMRTVSGKTICLGYHTCVGRPYSRVHLLSGTDAFAQKYPVPQISIGNDKPVSDEKMKELEQEFTPELHRHIGELAREFGGHGGMDFIEDWRYVNCLQNGLAPDMDVYDSALWSSLTPLSYWSVTHRSNSIDVPDFTCGAWKTNAPVDLSLRNSGKNTGMRTVKKS